MKCGAGFMMASCAVTGGWEPGGDPEKDAGRCPLDVGHVGDHVVEHGGKVYRWNDEEWSISLKEQPTPSWKQRKRMDGRRWK